MRKKIFYYKYKNKFKLTGSEYIVVGFLMYSSKYIKNDKYTFLISVVLVVIFLSLLSNSIWKLHKSHAKKKAFLNSKIHDIDNMSGVEFEGLLKAHFETQGYKVKLTPMSNDYGADLILFKDNIKTVVQAKRYREKVSNKAIQEIIGAKGYYKASVGMVVTNSYFTSNAEKVALANDIILWDRNILIQKFQIKS